MANRAEHWKCIRHQAYLQLDHESPLNWLNWSCRVHLGIELGENVNSVVFIWGQTPYPLRLFIWVVDGHPALA